MRVLLVLVDDQQCPFTIRALNGIRGDEHMPGAVLDIARGWIHTVRLTAWLHPFQVDELAREELAERLRDLAISINGKHAERASRVVTSGMHAHGNVMEVVNRVAARGEKRPDVVGQPQSAEDVHRVL